MRRLTASALAWILLASAPVHAQTRDARPETTAPTSPITQGAQPAAPVPPPSIERMRHTDGRLGYWLDEDAYTDALAALQLEAGYLEQLALLNRRLDVRATEVSELRLALGAMTRARDEIRSVVRTAEARRVAAERSRDAWFRSPALLVAIGVVLGAGFGLLMTWAIGETT